MRGQEPLALPPPAGSAHWMEQTLPGERTMREIAAANAGFVALALELHATRPGMPTLGLPAHLMPALARLGRRGIAGLGLPFVLFDLRFRHAPFWQAQVTASSAVQDGESAKATDERLVGFARGALALAWHLAQVDLRVARLALGLETTTQQLLAGLAAGSLESLACRVAPSLAARFCTRERFWLLLADAAKPGAAPCSAERVRLLGLQLQGADAARAQLLHRRARRNTQA